MVPKYDNELRDLILKRFHDQSNHCEYHKTYSAIAEKRIGITQEEVRAYVNECSACAINTTTTVTTTTVTTTTTAAVAALLTIYHHMHCQMASVECIVSFCVN